MNIYLKNPWESPKLIKVNIKSKYNIKISRLLTDFLHSTNKV